MSRGARLAALVLSGAAQALLLPPIQAWWLAPLFMVPALLALEGLRPWRAFLGGWLMGASSVVALGYWIAPTIARFGGLSSGVGLLALLAYALVFGAYAGVFAVCLAPLRAVTGRWWPYAAAAAWAACEWANPQLFAHWLGLAFAQRPELFLTTAVTGVAGLGFLIVLANGVVIQLVRARGRLAAPAAICLGLVGLALLHGSMRARSVTHAQASAPRSRVALLQDNLDVPARAALARQGDSAIALALVAQSERALAADPGIDVLVWAESALPGTPSGENTAAVRALVARHGVELWTGGHAWDDRGVRRYNAAFRVHGAGVVDPPYRKNILIPFGEYLPLADTLPFLQRLWGRPRNHPGTTQPVFATAAGKVSFLICYEAIKSSYVRRMAEVSMLVNLTYDGWFGDTSCPHLHLAAAALQSAQLGVPMARVSSTGISAVIDARGAVTARAPLFTPAVLVADLPRANVPSLYRRFGDWFALACLLTTLGLLARAAHARARQKSLVASGVRGFPES